MEDFNDARTQIQLAGNPGTGKTTVARLLAKIYKKIGVLSKGQLVETDRSGLVGAYVGHTALIVKETIEKAKGGVLFIDEAYALTRNTSPNDYGGEAIDTILKAMEDYRDELIVIVAGYPDLMQSFLESNPGLKSRFNKFIFFRDYSPDEQNGIVTVKDILDFLDTQKSFSNLKGINEDAENEILENLKSIGFTPPEQNI